MKKFKSAEAKKQALENQRSWEELMRKYPPVAASKTYKAREAYKPTPLHDARTTAGAPSLVTPGGSTAAKASQQYTGSAIKGIGTMHKSNMVPIFSDNEAEDIARMRR